MMCAYGEKETVEHFYYFVIIVLDIIVLDLCKFTYQRKKQLKVQVLHYLVELEKNF